MRLIFEQIRTGGDRNLAYVLGDGDAKVGAVIDPSFAPAVVVERASAQGLEVAYIINTHGHADHVEGNAEAKRLTGAAIAAFHAADTAPDVPLRDGDRLQLGGLELQFLHTPGHADDHLVVYLEPERVAITGDLLFVGKIGGTADDEHARVEYESLQRVLRELPDETTVWPGHDFGCRPASTMTLEKATNPFLMAKDLGAFLELKHDWPRFKAEHGLK